MPYICTPLTDKIDIYEDHLKFHLSDKCSTSGPNIFRQLDTTGKKVAFAAIYIIWKTAIAIAKIATPIFDGLYHVGCEIKKSCTEAYKDKSLNRFKKNLFNLPLALIEQIAQSAYNAVILFAVPFSTAKDIYKAYRPTVNRNYPQAMYRNYPQSV